MKQGVDDARAAFKKTPLLEVMKAVERIGCSYLGVYAVDVLRGMSGMSLKEKGIPSTRIGVKKFTPTFTRGSPSTVSSTLKIKIGSGSNPVAKRREFLMSWKVPDPL